MHKSARHLVWNVFIAAAGTLASSVLAVGYVSIGARWLGPSDYATVASTIALANVLALVLNPLETGVSLRVATLLGRDGPAAVQVFAVRALRGGGALAAALFASWWLIAPVVGPWIGYEAGALRWLGVFFCSSFAATVPRGVLRGRERFSAYTTNVTVESALRLLIGLSLISLRGGPSGMLAGYGLAQFFAMLFASVQMFAGLSTQQSIRPKFALADLAEPLRVLSGALIGIELYTALATNADVIAAEHFLPPAEAGLYAGGAQVARIVLVGATPVVTVLVSRIAVLSASRDDTKTILWQGAALVIGGVSLSCVIPLAAGELPLRILLGEAYVGAAPILRIQWATACVLTVQSFFALSTLATGNVRSGLVFGFPAVTLLSGLALRHETGLEIAWVTLLTCATAGAAAFWLLAHLAPSRSSQTRRPLVGGGPQ